MKIIPLLMATLFSLSSFAEDHGPASIEGSGSEIHLFERGHAFSGEILGYPVFGVFEHNPFGARIQIRKDEQSLELVFSEVGQAYLGTISETMVDGSGIQSVLQTEVSLEKIEKLEDAKGLITLKIDGQEIAVDVTGKSFQNGHFQAPTFTASVHGTPVSFAFTGESCFGYSSNIALMVYGAYAHLLKSRH